jgi:replication initiator protein
MGEVHDILAVKGRQATLTEWWDRAEAEAAANYLGDEDTSSVCLFSGFCQAALPHRKLASPADAWQITSEHITLIVDPGKRPGANGVPEPVGVPYGSRARLIMLYLQSEALSSSCREVQLGRSMRDWLGRMSVPVGGKQMAMIRDQAERISRCHLSFTIKSGRGERFEQQSIVEGAIFLTSEEGQGSLFPETAKLSEPFFRELQRHSVPLEEAAIRAIANNSMALDLYAWLAYRLHVLGGPTAVSWAALKQQFGTAFGTTFHFKPVFLSNLRLAMAVYPDAKVLTTERGVTLMPSRPPVVPRQIAIAKVHTPSTPLKKPGW